MKRFPSSLPSPHSQIRRRADLKENQPRSRFHDTVHATKSIHDAANGAQGEGADDRIHARVREGNAFARESEELDGQRCSAEVSFSQQDHSWIWLECVDLVDACRIVMLEVRPRTDANLQHNAPRFRQQLSATIADWCRVSQRAHELRIDPVSVEPHRQPTRAPSRFDDRNLSAPPCTAQRDIDRVAQMYVQRIERQYIRRDARDIAPYPARRGAQTHALPHRPANRQTVRCYHAAVPFSQ